MGNLEYIFGYAILFIIFISGIVGHFIGYRQRKNEEPQDIQELVDGWKKKSRY